MYVYIARGCGTPQISWHMLYDNVLNSNDFFCTQGGNLLSDSGNIIDKCFRGGRLGMYVFSQEAVYYSKLYAGSPEVKIRALSRASVSTSN